MGHAHIEAFRTDPWRRFSPSDDVIVTWDTRASTIRRPAFRIAGMTEQDIAFGAQSEGINREWTYIIPFIVRSRMVERAQSWIARCLREHGDDCGVGVTIFASSFPGLDVLRLIDVKKSCLVEVQSCHNYLALSYVWGAVSNFRLTKSNLSYLLVPGSVQKVFHRLPRTVSDAITLCQQLGFQYLWVDALCLLQNDAKDLEKGVNVMDQIYECAWLTIVAACGTNANAGLPGVQLGSRGSQTTALYVLPGIALGVDTGLSQLLKHSVYSSRGWTIFFRCKNMELSESCLDTTYARRPTSFWSSSTLPMALHMEDPLFDYCEMLFYYTARTLTDQNDVMRAMAGVIRRVSEKTKSRFIQGLPTAAWDSFITFTALNSILRRRRGFPSYSWCGWQGRISLEPPTNWNSWLTKTWIIWYKRSPSGITNLVWDPAANESFPFHDKSYVGYRHRQKFEPPVPLGFPTTRTAVTEALELPSPMPPYPVLQFWTLALYLKLDHLNVFDGKSRLRGKSGAECGHTFLDGFEESEFFSSKEPYEFIVRFGKKWCWGE
ncbi:hypothetical protein N0V84_007469 [Fusarium piperis]|uniref:Heterokaryon incompatibility domain-containing protein n=1 Tax=Fusarium piperis TaxID=1435070 RepID=A0A9W9BM79_9HYPO|nr:hypothetical protein N0V84_007469 [Fusarium piperis]